MALWRCLAVLFCVACLGYGQAAVATGSVEGHVTNSMTGETISGADVDVVAVSGSQHGAESETSSQPDGTFRLDSLAPGQYVVSVEKDGFASPRSTRGMAVVNVEAGQLSSGLQLRLTPDGGVSGTVVDENGAPEGDVQVFALTLNGDRLPARLQSARSQSTTDRAGHFSLSELDEGNYYLVAVPDADAAKPRQDGYEQVPTYYPESVSFADASPVLVRAGEVSSAEIKLHLALTHRVTGKLADGVSISGRTALQLFPTEALRVPMLSRSATVNPDRTFSISGVPSGSYLLTLSLGPQRGRRSSRVRVEVGSDDVSGIVVMPPQSVALKGSVTLDTPNSTCGRVSIRAVPMDRGSSVSASLPACGPFALNGLGSSEYLFVVQSGQAGVYVSSLTLNGRDILNQFVDVSDASAGELAAVLHSGTGEIKGNLADNASSMVVLVPKALAPDGSNVHIAYPANDGTFDFRNNPPGNYLVYATERTNAAMWMKPAFLQAVEALGTAVHVDENGSAQVKVQQTDQNSLRDQALRAGLNFQ